MRARLYLDEDVIPELARILRSHGWDAITTHETRALGLSDEEQLTRASAEGRALLTFNYRDFLRIGGAWFLAARPHAGIIVSYQQYSRHQIRELAAASFALLDALSAENLSNSVYVLDQFRRR